MPQCAASLTACHLLMQGSDFSNVEKALKQYMPTLEYVAQKPSLYQSSAARLAAQGRRFLAVLAFHHLDIERRIQHYSKALDYSRLTEDANLQATMLNNMGIAYAPLKQPEQAMCYYQEALQLESALSPLVRSVLSSRVAFSQAQLGQEHEALVSLDKVRTVLPDHPENDPAFLFVDAGNTQMYAGWTYFELSRPYHSDTSPNKTHLERTWSAYMQITENPEQSVSERVRIQIVNHQAAAAIAQRDLEKFQRYFLEGVRGAKTLNS